VDRIRQVAELIGEASIAEIRRGVEEVYNFLANHLKPHAEAEDAALYPVVQQVLGSPDATKTMSRDHVEVGRYIEELAGLKDGLTGRTLTCPSTAAAYYSACTDWSKSTLPGREVYLQSLPASRPKPRRDVRIWKHGTRCQRSFR
jgi:iron-sulfur cluster repair protein YtfE (RIC family)